MTAVDLDMNNMHRQYGVHDAVDKLSDDKLKALARFRLDFLKEELREGYKAFEEGDPEEYVDAMIDIVVVAVGTLNLFGVDFHKAWREVLKANLSKEVGVKASRPNPLGLPDLIKPEGWVGPTHEGNHGTLTNAFGVRDDG
jgi:predicted HAD superfamily Cof-like phosphohydrolase